MPSLYLSVDVEQCRILRHKLQVVGSDKTPLKRSLMCVTCSLASGKSAYAAYGVEQGSFGDWHEKRKTADVPEMSD